MIRPPVRRVMRTPSSCCPPCPWAGVAAGPARPPRQQAVAAVVVAAAEAAAAADPCERAPIAARRGLRMGTGCVAARSATLPPIAARRGAARGPVPAAAPRGARTGTHCGAARGADRYPLRRREGRGPVPAAAPRGRGRAARRRPGAGRGRREEIDHTAAHQRTVRLVGNVSADLWHAKLLASGTAAEDPSPGRVARNRCLRRVVTPASGRRVLLA
ncbi:hypothetical protein J3R04_000275 [Spirilliplanes yamanashiensis]|nr:hypothetical protein [Spirilliplanes yamanashiensis]